MASSWMQTKVPKMRRSRSKIPKSYCQGYVKVKQGVVQSFPRSKVSTPFSRMFEESLPSRFTGVTPARVEAQKRKQEINSKFDSCLMVVILDNYKFRVTLISKSPQMDCYVLIREDKRKQVVHTSIEYNSRERILFLFKQDKISYVEYKT